MIEEIKSVLRDNLVNNGRILLIANNPIIPDHIFATLDISKNDLVVVFNKVIHQEKLVLAKKVIIFQNNHLGKAWGFDASGRPDETVKAVFQSENPPLCAIFTHKVPLGIAGQIPSNIPAFSVPPQKFLSYYPSLGNGRTPSAGYYGAELISKAINELRSNARIYLVGFSGRFHNLGEKVSHDWFFERSRIDANEHWIKVFCQSDMREHENLKRQQKNFLLPSSLAEVDDAKIKMMVKKATRREDVIDFVRPDGIGIELGVAEGEFSERVLRKNKLSFLYSVDMYAGDRGHNVTQYARALKRLTPFRDKNMLIKMKFDEALEVFDDESIDFVYVDGYAHTGEDDGKHFAEWWRKIRYGGILAGDDYSKSWPKVIKSVDRFISSNELPFFLIDVSESSTPWSKSPTWFTIKRGPLKLG